MLWPQQSYSKAFDNPFAMVEDLKSVFGFATHLPAHHDLQVAMFRLKLSLAEPPFGFDQAVASMPAPASKIQEMRWQTSSKEAI